MVYRIAGKSCPRCGVALENEIAGPREFDRCANCFGAWLTQATLKNMLDEMGAVGPMHLATSTIDEPELRCPDCSKAMTKGMAYGMNIDVCPHEHGLWFDRDELEKSLQGAGGVEVSEFKLSDASLLQQMLSGKLR